jgi:Mrp family chromosome partitioning ATPase
MVELNAEMAELWATLGAPAPGRGRLVTFMAARNGEGVSTVAREFAWFAASRAGRRTWLVDLDLNGAAQCEAIEAEPERFGRLGPAATATPDGSMFFTVQPALRGPDGRPWADARYLGAHRVGEKPLWVTRFRRDALQGRQGVHVMPTADYWNALRRHSDLIVIDAPAAERSQAGLIVAPFVDDVVLVVAADEPDVRAPALLRDAVQDAGGHCAGLFFNRQTVVTPGFIKAILP